MQVGDQYPANLTNPSMFDILWPSLNVNYNLEDSGGNDRADDHRVF